MRCSDCCMGSEGESAAGENPPSLFVEFDNVFCLETSPGPRGDPTFGKGEVANVDNVIPTIPSSPILRSNEPHHQNQSIFIGISTSPFDSQLEQTIISEAKFHSQPISTEVEVSHPITTAVGRTWGSIDLRKKLWIKRLKEKRFDSFKTWFGKLESKASEKLVLPEDEKWPFLLRFQITTFGMCLGVSSQAVLWKTIATSPSTTFLRVSPKANLVLWCFSLAFTSVVTFVYSLKIIFYFEAVRREYFHPIRVNFFFAPWTTCLLLAIGIPPSIAVDLHDALWYALMAPILLLDLKIYGQWMSGGNRRLSKVANPTNHVAIIGNFVGALLGASMGLKEGPIFFFAVGLAHYAVLFVTLYQRLPTNETLPRELHPVFFLFVSAPSVASVAWARITGEFGYGSRMAYFIAMFLYVSLAVRINFFSGFRFSLAWWAYTFPMTAASVATFRYAVEVENLSTQALSAVLSGIASLSVSTLLVLTTVHAFVRRDLFPNDIAIMQRKPKSRRKHSYPMASSDDKDVETCGSY